jgi:hypothetical protein
MSKPLAKSLHTVTVLVRVARDIQARQPMANDDAVTYALNLLGLADMPDMYGLALQAEKQLRK